MEKVNHKVKNCLYNASYEKWSRIYAAINIGRMMTSNIIECMNGCLVNAHEFSVLGFMKKQGYFVGHETAKIEK